jgi:hypothetical protein
MVSGQDQDQTKQDAAAELRLRSEQPPVMRLPAANVDLLSDSARPRIGDGNGAAPFVFLK